MTQTNNDGYFSEEEMSSLKRIALEELRELCDDLAKVVPALGENPADGDARKQAVHIFHTIGGSAALAGFADISAVGVDMEGAIKKQGGDGPLPGDLVQRIGQAFQQLDSMVSDAEKTL